MTKLINNMTPLEEKIEIELKKLEEDGEKCSYDWTMNGDLLLEFVKKSLESISQQAVEEERQRILDDLPKPANIANDHGLSFNEMTGWNDCLSQVRNIISKPNI